MAAFTDSFCSYLKKPYYPRFWDKNCKQFVNLSRTRLVSRFEYEETKNLKVAFSAQGL